MEDKKRSQNFTSAEKSLLFHLIAEKYADILEDKKTDRASLQKRDFAWKNIERDFNAGNPSNIYRSADVLRKLYSNRKKDLRKRVAEEKKEVLLTGGGIPTKILKPNDDADAVLLTILNEKSLHGLSNSFDCDASTLIQKESIQNSVDLEYIIETSDFEGYISKTNEPSTSKDTPFNWKSYTPADLQTKKDPVLVVSSDKNSENSTFQKTSRRRPITGVKTLTSSAVAEKYNLLLDRRLVLVNQQIEQGKEEHLLNMRKKTLELNILEEELRAKKKNSSNF